ncbi:MAG TPA: peptidase M28 [Geobacter sp.]|nr:peptidase M28 [Geobacter sp.]
MVSVDAALAAVSLDRIRGHIRSLEGVRHPVTAPAALVKAEGYIAATLGDLGYAVNLEPFQDSGCTFNNVVATKMGTTSPLRRVLVVAHFDTVADSPGADDNASGVAVLLEMATLLKNVRFEKSILFVGVNLEENADESISGTGTRGSRALARLAKEQGWDIEGVVVLESVAFAGNTVLQTTPAGLPLEVPKEGDFIAVIGNEASPRLVEGFRRAIESYRVDLPCVPLVVPGNGELIPDTRRSDHAPFWDHGFPAVMLTDTTNFRNRHYHQPTDTLDTLNIPFAGNVCKAAAGLVADLALPCAVTG